MMKKRTKIAIFMISAISVCLLTILFLPGVLFDRGYGDQETAQASEGLEDIGLEAIEFAYSALEAPKYFAGGIEGSGNSKTSYALEVHVDKPEFDESFTSLSYHLQVPAAKETEIWETVKSETVLEGSDDQKQTFEIEESGTYRVEVIAESEPAEIIINEDDSVIEIGTAIMSTVSGEFDINEDNPVVDVQF